MKIAVIGAGNIGGTLGRAWAARHRVNFGVRSPQDSKYDPLRAVAEVMAAEQALEGAQAVLLALPGPAVAEFAAGCGAALEGRVVIDAANNVRSAEMNSLGALRAAAPGAHLARAFNSTGWENFAQPVLGGQPVDLFYCAQPAAKPVLEQLIGELGLRPIYTGDLDTAPLLDNLTRLWFALAHVQGRGRRIAFKLQQDHP
ncbi:MAG: NADPH-dependent F420 reductase [Chloroflexota bacterium]